MKFGLGNMSALCAALGHPERQFDSLLVAGTNGKGSVTAMVHRALVAAGHHAARYTSPHLERLEERYAIGDREVTRVELGAAARAVRDAVETRQYSEALEAPPTFFECATAMAFLMFREAGVRLAVLEVGLGGRLDATNVVTPVAVAITSIDYDHQAQLGTTLEAIAFEKAGVIRPGIPVVCGEMAPAAEHVIEDVCARHGARFVRATECADRAGPSPAIGLRGAHQRRNGAVARCLLLELDRLGIAIGPDAMRAGLAEVVWPGRLELFPFEGAEVLIDAAHNPAGAAALAAYLHEARWTGAALVFGAVEDKDVRGMLASLAPACSAIVCTTPETPRALPAAVIADLAQSTGEWAVSVVADPAEALRTAARAHPRVVAAGSIFLIGPLRGILRRR